uniref:Uncharacterized protein n=1 Tax=Rhizophora mucronata TaxID=61149 RepID=A0A2P2NAI5_RHIMU
MFNTKMLNSSDHTRLAFRTLNLLACLWQFVLYLN